MTNPDLTLLVILADRSGSMNKIKTDAEGGIKALIAEQRAVPGSLNITLFEFDDKFNEAPDVDKWKLVPRGSTALLDAMGKAITIVGERLALLDEPLRPAHVIFLISTDGQENASQEWTRDQVFLAVSTQTDIYGWEFLYQGSNQDAIAVGRGLGIRGQTLTYVDTPEDVARAYFQSSAGITRSRTGQ